MHSCGAVPPHGVDELTHPEPGFYAVGVKSYGRVADTGLATGVEGALLTIPLVEVSTGGCCG